DRPGPAGEAARTAARGGGLRLPSSDGAGPATRPQVRHGPPGHQACEPPGEQERSPPPPPPPPHPRGGRTTPPPPPRGGGRGGGATFGIIKILDMGLARFQESPHSATTLLTQIGSVVGTPDFISPEQARTSHAIDIRSDLYSLGCTGYFLLTGQPPFTTGGIA